MNRSVSGILAAFVVLSGPFRAAEPPVGGTAAAAEAPIVVTINPEGRVSVRLDAAIPSSVRPGTPVAWPVRVINQGYVTGVLLAELVGDPAPGAILDFNPERLKGSPLEMRTLRITLTRAAPTDLTLAFRLKNESPDLGGRDRVHVLIRPL
jgi:hypothetical protein